MHTSIRPGAGSRLLPDRADGPDFHAAYLRGRGLRGDLNGLVEVARLDQIETGELLLRLGERAVRDGQAAVAHPHRRRGGNRLQSLRGDAMPARTQVTVVCQALAIVHLTYLLLLAVYQTQVFHRRTFAATVCMLNILDRTISVRRAPMDQSTPKGSRSCPQRSP